MLLNRKALLLLYVLWAHVFLSAKSRNIDSDESSGGEAMSSKSVRRDADDYDDYEDESPDNIKRTKSSSNQQSRSNEQLASPRVSKKSGDQQQHRAHQQQQQQQQQRVSPDMIQRSAGPSFKKEEKLLKSFVPEIADSIIADESELNRAKASLGGVDELEDSDSTDEDFVEDQGIFPILSCDYAVDNICWYNREIGDSITLALNASGFPNDELAIRWSRIYGAVDSAKHISRDFTTDQIPWNIIIGSGGMELRISPITNTDTDRNGLLAKVYMASEGAFGRRFSKLLREIVFRINILPIDMGSVYAGEELMIGIESFITLPVKGITLEWGIEESIGKSVPLPSNMKISKSGRTILVKELHKTEMMISCVMYSTTGISVAKRRFKIQRPENLGETHSVDLRRRSAPSLESSQQQIGEQIGNNNNNELQQLDGEQQQRRRDVGNSLVRERYRYDIPLSSRKKIFKRSVAYDDDETGMPSIGSLQRIFNVDESLPQNYSTRLIAPTSNQVSLGQNSVVIPPKETHFASLKALMTTSRHRREDHEFPINCTSNYDCGPKASCIFLDASPGERVPYGHCECDPEYEGDGRRCRKPPRRREDRVRRQVLYPGGQTYPADNEMAIRPELFYANKAPMASASSSSRNQQLLRSPPMFRYRVGRDQQDRVRQQLPLADDDDYEVDDQEGTDAMRRRSPARYSEVPYYNAYPDDLPLNEKRSLDQMIAEEESVKALSNNPSSNLREVLTNVVDEDDYDKSQHTQHRLDVLLVHKCSDKLECSPHATCETSPALVTICQCENGFRGNGIFCWETMD